MNVTSIETNIKVGKSFDYNAPALSLTVIRIKTEKQ